MCLLTGWSREVRVMKRRKSSEPEATDMEEVELVRILMASVISSRSPTNVAAAQVDGYYNKYVHIWRKRTSA